MSEIARRGLGRTFQVARVFNEMSLLDNMLVPTVPQRMPRRQAERRALELLELAGLAELKNQVAVEISGGQKKLLEFMRTMMFEPGADPARRAVRRHQPGADRAADRAGAARSTASRARPSF